MPSGKQCTACFMQLSRHFQRCKKSSKMVTYRFCDKWKIQTDSFEKFACICQQFWSSWSLFLSASCLSGLPYVWYNKNLWLVAHSFVHERLLYTWFIFFYTQIAFSTVSRAKQGLKYARKSSGKSVKTFIHVCLCFCSWILEASESTNLYVIVPKHFHWCVVFPCFQNRQWQFKRVQFWFTELKPRQRTVCFL